jgi:hypothetical protein
MSVHEQSARTRTKTGARMCAVRHALVLTLEPRQPRTPVTCDMTDAPPAGCSLAAGVRDDGAAAARTAGCSAVRPRCRPHRHS